MLLHALLIYVSLVDYYRWAEETAEDAREDGWMGNRWRTLEAGAAKLLVALRESLAGRPESLRFVDAVAACAN